MPRKSARKFSVPKEVRRQARERVGTPPPTKVEVDRRHKPPKHKKKPDEDEASLAGNGPCKGGDATS